MTSFNDIIDALSRHDSRPTSTVRHMVRLLRQDGRFGNLQPGRGTRPATYRDAAICLIAWTGAPMPSDAVEVLNRIEPLEPWGRLKAPTVPAPFQAIRDAPTPLDAVEALLIAAASPLTTGAGITVDAVRRKLSVGLEWRPTGHRGNPLHIGSEFTPPPMSDYDCTLAREVHNTAGSRVVMWLARMLAGVDHPLWETKADPAIKTSLGAGARNSSSVTI